MSAIDGIFNYYLTTYGHTSSSSRYESHKKSELRELYNKIVKENREEPLYKIDVNEDLEKFVIDLKENARRTKNLASYLTGTSAESVFDRKTAVSSDPDSVAVEFIGDENTADTSARFTLGIEKLAGPQINMGNFLKDDGHDLEEGNFSFDLDTSANSYEFQLNIDGDETNFEIQKKIQRLINRSNVGINAELISDGKDSSHALKITSTDTGLKDDENYIFKIQSGLSWNEVRTLGIDHVSKPAENAVFSINGKKHTSLSNEFTVNNSFKIDLKKSNSEVVIGFKTDVESISDNIAKMLSSYNSMLTLGENYSKIGGYNRLYNEVNSLYQTKATNLSKAGIKSQEDGHLFLDKDKLEEEINGGSREMIYKALDEFKNALSREADKISLNPMRYVDKKVVEYKNPGHTFNAPYAESIYSGLLVDAAL